MNDVTPCPPLNLPLDRCQSASDVHWNGDDSAPTTPRTLPPWQRERSGRQCGADEQSPVMSEGEE